MKLTTEEIFALLPAFMRLRDADQGAAVKGRIAPADDRDAVEFGPLHTLASLITREAQVVDEQIDQLYDDAFIETCAPWVVAYLGDLLGVRGLSPIPGGPDLRAWVADALALRARKGTLRALEHAAWESAGLPVLAVEYGRRLVHAQSMRLVHPGMGAAPDLRDRPGLARIGQPVERASRGVEVRRIDSRAFASRGRWNLGNIGLHVWRLRISPISRHQLAPAASGRRIFRFHPLGCDAQLFDSAPARPPIEQPMQESALPIAITRAVMAEDPGRFYGEGRAIRIWAGNDPIPLDEIRAAHLGDRATGGTEPWNRAPLPDLTLIDPELGRIVIGQNRSGPIRVSCRFARPFEIGGGEHDRRQSLGSVEDPVILAPSVQLATRVASEGGTGTILLDQSTHYSSGASITVPDGGLLRILAGDGRFPTLRLPATLTLTLGRAARVELNGLRLHGGTIVLRGDPAAPGQLTLRDCTLVPGLALDRDGNATSPGTPSLQIEAHGLALRLERVITGPVQLAQDVEAGFSDCILDAGSRAARAIFAPPDTSRHVISLIRTTVLGRVETDAFAGAMMTDDLISDESADQDALPASSDTLFLGETPAISATRRQTGCIRFSLVPQGSLAPRLYRRLDGPIPSFVSQRSCDPGYMLFAPGSAEALRRGAENGGEIGAYNGAGLTARQDNIARCIQDFLRFGHAAGIFHAT